ncbi:MAG: IS200/IS605 family accessory protein TnpB-related protein [archaeon]
MLRTYQTKIEFNTNYLDEVASFFGMIERKLFLDLLFKKKKRNECKKEYIKKYQITARQFNSIYVVLDGKIKAIKEINKNQIRYLNDKITSIQFYLKRKEKTKERIYQQLKDLEGQDKCQFKKKVKQYRHIKFSIHQKKRLLHRLNFKLKQLKRDQQDNKIRICFGSRRLFHKQFNLNENNFKNHEEWKKEWESSRNRIIYCIGSKDESSGNQTCTYTSNHNLRLRVVNQLTPKYGKYILFEDIKFPYGQDSINQAIKTYYGLTKGNKKVKYCHSAISYRFIKKEKGWYIFATVNITPPKYQTLKGIGSIGVDLNAGFVSCCEIDRFGNPIKQKRISMNTYHRRKNQVKATIGEAVKEIIEYGIKTQKPIVVETLDFKKKKASLKEEMKKQARMLSSFTYSKFIEMIQLRAERYGVEVIQVNPQYSSIIGQIKYMKRYGLSSHASAACIIARRGVGYQKERIPYRNSLGNFYHLINQYKTIQQRWIQISKSIKKKYSFKNRIFLLQRIG